MASKINIQPEDVLNGLSAVISVNVIEPKFSSQAKIRLGDKAVGDAIYNALVKEFNKIISEMSESDKAILSKKIINNAKIRQAAEIARETKKKSVTIRSSADLPSKLKDCAYAGRSDLCELYICEGDSACFCGDTEVKLVDGRTLSMEQLYNEYKAGKDNYVWSVDHFSLKAVKITEVKLVKHNARVKRYYFDDGTDVVCTPDHKFMLVDGTYKEIDKITSDDQLSNYHFDIVNGRNYYNSHPLYATVAKQYLGERPFGWHTHHLDKNKLNDVPENLVYTDSSEHSKIHSNKEIGMMHSERMKSDKEYYDHFVSINKKFWNNYWGIDIHRAEQSEREKKYFEDPDNRAKTGKATHIGMQKITHQEHVLRRYRQNYSCTLAFIKRAVSDGLISINDLYNMTEEEYKSLKHKLNINNGLAFDFNTFKSDILTIDNLEEAVSNANHRLIRSEDVENTDVYDLFVPPYLNYRLANGIIVHNCGTILSARDGNYQAVLPIRGKVLNVMKLDFSNKKQRERFNNNAEIDSMIKAIGAGVGEHFDIDKARYGKVIFACFTGDTKVFMLDGTVKTFEELVAMENENPGQEYWVYSTTKDGRMVPGCAKNPRITSYTNTIAHVVLDNGEEIKCTPDHRFLNRDGIYIQAKDLTPGTSLMPMYFKYNDNKNYNYNRQMYLDNVDGKWKFTHVTVFDTFNEYKGTGWSRHHIDGNYLNNLPSNIVQIPSDEHKAFHGSQSLTKYNKSEENREVASKIGKAYGTINITKYNKSEKHRKVASEIGKTYGKNNIVSYNTSDTHKETVINMNKDENIKKLQKRGVAASVLAFMANNDYPLTKEGFDRLKNEYVFKATHNWNEIVGAFDSYDQMYDMAKNHKPANLVRTEDYVVPDSAKGVKSKITHIINRLKLEGLEINEENYTAFKGSRGPKWESITTYFGSVDEAIKAAETSNHMVREVWFEDVPTTPMYDFTVDTYHNFVAATGDDSGVVVHQCDSDVDGLAISCYLLGIFYTLFRPMIEAGMVYQCVSPFYELKYRDHGTDKSLYAVDESERIALERQLRDQNIKYTLARAKGLGELNSDVFHDIVLNPTNRKLIRITMRDAKHAAEMLRLSIGQASADDRKEWMIENNSVIEKLGLYQ